jgi:hypothetical protein
MREEIDKHLQAVRWLIPGWVQLLSIVVTDGSGGETLGIQPDYKYRLGVLYVYSGWFTSTREEKMKAFIHEMIHFYSGLPTDYAAEKFEVVIGDTNPDLMQVIKKDLSEREEQMTQDLAFAIYNKLYAKNGRQ